MSWRWDAACRDTDPGLFFGEDGETAGRKRLREARAAAVCAACPVRAACLNDAMRGGAEFGIWGGHAARQGHGRHMVHFVAVTPARLETGAAA